MSFNINSAMAGAGSGAALGPWGAVGGAVLGGFFGGDEPEMYGREDYMGDMAPYQDMVNQQMDQSQMLQDPNSWLNRQQNQSIMNNSMDQMGVSNMMNERNNASNPYINSGGMNNQQSQQNMLQFANQGLTQGRQNFNTNFKQGANQYQNAMTHQGDISAGLANLMAGNVGTMNEYNQGQANQGMSGLGGLFGQIGGMGSAQTDAQGNVIGIGNDGFSNFMDMGPSVGQLFGSF